MGLNLFKKPDLPKDSDIERAKAFAQKKKEREEAAKEAKAKAEKQKANRIAYEKELDKMYSHLFETELGKLILEDIKKVGCVNQSVYDQDEKQHLLNSGKQQLALYILNRTTKKD